MTVGVLTGLAAVTRISVNDEKVWLQDPSRGITADETGTDYWNDAWTAAVARARTYTGNGKPVIAGRPGTYKWDTSKGTMIVPSGVRLSLGSGSPQSATLYFPVDTELPTAIGVCATGVTAGASTLSLTNVKNTIPPVVGGSMPAIFANVPFTYAGVSQVGSNATLTGCVGLPATPAEPNPFIAGPAIWVGALFGRSYGLDRSINVQGPASGSSAWATATPPTDAMDGVFVGNSAGIDCSISGFRQNAMYMGDHETFGGHVYFGNGWCNYACESPHQFNWLPVDTGNQIFEQGASLSGGAYWCQHYISAGNCLLAANFAGQIHMGNAPWWMWKAPTVGVTGAASLIMSDTHLDSAYFEGVGLGIIGCPDGGGSLAHVTFRNGGANFYDFSIPSPYTAPVAVFACNFSSFLLDGFNGLTFLSSGLATGVPMFIADGAMGRFTNMQFDMVAALEAHPPRAYSTDPIVNVKLDMGVISSGFAGGAVKGDLLAARLPSLGGYRGVSTHEGFDGRPRHPTGVALTDETGYIVSQATNSAAGQVAANVRVRATPPTSPSATTSATAGTRSAGAHYYKIAAILSGGGVTGASSEVNVTLSGTNSADLSWTAPASPPHSQAIAGYRIYHGTATGVLTAYVDTVGTGTTYMDSGASLTAGTPTTNNVGCEVYYSGGVWTYVRGYGDDTGFTWTGKVCTATGPTDPNGPVVGYAVGPLAGGAADNGTTVQIIIAPALV